MHTIKSSLTRTSVVERCRSAAGTSHLTMATNWANIHPIKHCLFQFCIYGMHNIPLTDARHSLDLNRPLYTVRLASLLDHFPRMPSIELSYHYAQIDHT